MRKNIKKIIEGVDKQMNLIKSHNKYSGDYMYVDENITLCFKDWQEIVNEINRLSEINKKNIK